MSEHLSREIHLKSRPVGLPEESNFELVEVTVGAPEEGELVVRNHRHDQAPFHGFL